MLKFLGLATQCTSTSDDIKRFSKRVQRENHKHVVSNASISTAKDRQLLESGRRYEVAIIDA
jgi:hypothetical protein